MPIRVKNCLLPLLLSFLLCPHLTTAQDAQRQTPGTGLLQTTQANNLIKRHVTDQLARLPEAQQAILDFQRDKNKPAGTIHKTQPIDYSTGARATFRVMKNLVTNPTWEERSFTLSASSNVAYIWVEDNELSAGRVDNDDIAALETALLLATPDASINPSKGIVENNNVYFGNPPNVDGDGRLDILLYDISEGGSNNNFYVAGFVTPADLTASGGGNNRDVLYLDTNPGVSSRPINALLATAAHEYQHLIHYNYDFSEQVFVNEGLSEWAEVLNGYPARSMTFLSNPETYNVRLLEWESGDDVLDDYQRAGLFTGYLAERMPPEATAAITRNTNRGRRGYEEALNQEGLDFEEVLKDYHTANLLNGTSVAALDPAFQYHHPAYNNVGAIPTHKIDGLAVEATPTTEAFIEAGGVQYLVWEHVADFLFNLDTIDPFEALRNRLALRVVLESQDGQIRFEDLYAPQVDKYYAGAYNQITIIASHVDAELTSRLGITYDAVWGKPVEGTVNSVVYDNGAVTSGTFFSLSAGANGAVATRFDLPAESSASLLQVSISPYYVNQFPDTGVPDDAPRDLTLKLWDVLPDGKPGNELFSLEVSDPRTAGTASSTLNHFDIDLSAYQDQLAGLPETFFIGYGEAGADANYMVIGPSDYAAEDRSYVTRNNGQWGALWETQFADGGPDNFPLQGTVVPLRALFATNADPVAVDDDAVAPAPFALQQNYPNPFGQRTTIDYSLSHPEEVTLIIYNVLGQRVKTLVNQFQAAGNYSITFQADSLPNGLYLYTLKAGSKQQSHPMTIITP